MSKVKVVGDALVIKSAAKYEDIALIQKYRPEALVLMGGDDGKVPVFAISVCDGGTGEVSKYGMTFCSASHDNDRLATITLPLPPTNGEDVKDVIADKYGAAIAYLDKIEQGIASVVEAIKTERTAFKNTITVE